MHRRTGRGVVVVIFDLFLRVSGEIQDEPLLLTFEAENCEEMIEFLPEVLKHEHSTHSEYKGDGFRSLGGLRHLRALQDDQPRAWEVL